MIPRTPSQWAHSCMQEATRNGLRVEFHMNRGLLTARFFSGEFFTYDRVYLGK